MKTAVASAIFVAALFSPRVGLALMVECDQNMKREIRAGYDVGQAVIERQYEFLGELITEIMAKSNLPKTYVSFSASENARLGGLSDDALAILALLEKKREGLSECVKLIANGR